MVEAAFKDFNHEDGDKANNLLIIEAGAKKYKFEGKFSKDEVKTFVVAAVAGELESYVKSGPLPPPAKKGEVAIIVAKNFKEIVEDPDSEVFIEFYAPWCGT
jgi:hypothetical protein